MLTIQCPKCRQLWKLPEYNLNQSVKCDCGYGFIAKSQKDCLSMVSSWKIKPELKKKIKGYIREGSDIVEVSTTGDDCPKCGPYERRLLSITGKTIGLPDLESAIGGGLFHKGCKHTIYAVPLAVAFKDHDRSGYPLSGYNSRQGEAKFQSAENFRNNMRATITNGARIGMNHREKQMQDRYEDAKTNVLAMIILAVFVFGIIMFIIGACL